MYFGGNSEMRGYDYLPFVGQNVVFANAELRFPLIEAMLTPIGVLGGIRGVFVRQHRRRLLPEPRHGLQVLYEQQPDVHADRRLPEPDHRYSPT